jgi:translation initiation factor IF-2
MRARGAQVTDIAIVIAADDDIMPQTKEAISRSSSRCSNYICNKVDKPNANREN